MALYRIAALGLALQRRRNTPPRLVTGALPSVEPGTTRLFGMGLMGLLRAHNKFTAG
jgi:hypothetical protein